MTIQVLSEWCNQSNICVNPKMTAKIRVKVMKILQWNIDTTSAFGQIDP